jgi:hypothetical protein
MKPGDERLKRRLCRSGDHPWRSGRWTQVSQCGSTGLRDIVHSNVPPYAMYSNFDLTLKGSFNNGMVVK